MANLAHSSLYTMNTIYINIAQLDCDCVIYFANALSYGFRGSPGTAAIVKLEHWFLVFSLLATASSSVLGTQYVWEIICFLIDNNLISNMNFSPCRHLVIQFMSR
jgi:hypothetical protein